MLLLMRYVTTVLIIITVHLANPTVRGIQQCSKQSFQPHHPGVSDPPPLDFFFLTNLLEKCYISVQKKGLFTHIVT